MPESIHSPLTTKFKVVTMSSNIMICSEETNYFVTLRPLVSSKNARQIHVLSITKEDYNRLELGMEIELTPCLTAGRS